MTPAQAGLFATLSPWWPEGMTGLQRGPDQEWLARIVQEAGLQSGSGLPLTLAEPCADGLGYEERIWTTGRVETRLDNWHDFFNGLVWLAFPKAKQALNVRHWKSRLPGTRGAARDAMTHLDECGILVACSCPELLGLLRDFQWKRLFWEERERLQAHMEFHVFGHATYEQLLAPFRGLTAKAVLYPVAPEWHAQSLEARRQSLDCRLAEDIGAGHYLAPKELHPLPLLGIPGLVPESAAPAHYDDTWQFRSGRRETTGSRV